MQSTERDSGRNSDLTYQKFAFSREGPDDDPRREREPCTTA